VQRYQLQAGFAAGWEYLYVQHAERQVASGGYWDALFRFAELDVMLL
jgi:hypothetical protein